MRMKICNKCNKRFKYRVLIDGKSRNTARRKFCTECVPFVGKRPTPTKFCEKCNKKFALSFKIDGVLRRLKKRKLCLECLPFGSGQPSRKEKRLCGHCGNVCKERDRVYCSGACHQVARTTQKALSGLCVPSTLKRYLLMVKERKCEICQTAGWMEKEVPLIMDHIDGDHRNNKIENLRLVCGNCDMQLPTYKAKNKGKGRLYRRKESISLVSQSGLAAAL